MASATCCSAASSSRRLMMKLFRTSMLWSELPWDRMLRPLEKLFLKPTGLEMIEVDLENVGELMVLHRAGEQDLQRIG